MNLLVIQCNRYTIIREYYIEVSKYGNPNPIELIPIRFELEGYGKSEAPIYVTKSQLNTIKDLLYNNKSEETTVEELTPFTVSYMFGLLSNHNKINDKMSFPRYIVADGKHYTDGGNFNFNSKGHSGRHFVYKFNESDETYNSDNIWFQATLPEYMNQYMPNNAEFIN